MVVGGSTQDSGGKHMASYAGQVQDMKDRIDGLQEALRQNGKGRSAAGERAEDLGKLFADQALKVEGLGRQIDVLSDELKHWEHRSKCSSTQNMPGEEELACSAVLEEEQECTRISISTKDLEMKRRTMAVKRKTRHEAKRRKVQEMQQHKLAFKVGVPGTSRSSLECRRKAQGVRTGQLRKSGYRNDNSSFVKSLQSELLRLKELLEERDQELGRERCSRSQTEVQALLRDAEDSLRQERHLRADAEEKMVALEARVKRLQEDGAVAEPAIGSDELRQALELEAQGLKAQLAALQTVVAELQLSKEQGAMDAQQLQAQLLQLQKVAADKSREVELERNRRTEEHRKSSAALSNLEMEVACYKRLASQRASELKVERKLKLKMESQLKHQMDAAKAQPKLCAQLRSDGQSYESISHKQNRRLQLNLKKLRQKYDQLQEAFRKEQDFRVAEGSCFRRLEGACTDQLVKLHELELVMDRLHKESSCNWFKSRQVDGEKLGPLWDGGNSPQGAGDSQMETSEKLLFLLDKLAKGGSEKQPEQQHLPLALDKLDELFSQVRQATRAMRSALNQELAWCLESEQRRGADGAQDEEQEQQRQEMELLLSQGSGLTAEQQVDQLIKVCAIQGKRLRRAEAKLLTFKKHVLRLKSVAEERAKELEQVRSSEGVAQLKVLEIELLECRRQAQEKAKDLRHERSLRFDLESTRAAEVQQLRLELQELQTRTACEQRETQTEEEAGTEMLGVLVKEKAETAAREERRAVEAESRVAELTSLLAFAHAEIAAANSRLEQASACQAHKVLELTGLLELFVARFGEQQQQQAQLECRLQEEVGCKQQLEEQLASEGKMATRLEQRVRELEMSSEVLKCRDKVWRRGLLAFDQVLLICLGAMFAFNKLVRDLTAWPT